MIGGQRVGIVLQGGRRPRSETVLSAEALSVPACAEQLRGCDLPIHFGEINVLVKSLDV